MHCTPDEELLNWQDFPYFWWKCYIQCILVPPSVCQCLCCTCDSSHGLRGILVLLNHIQEKAFTLQQNAVTDPMCMTCHFQLLNFILFYNFQSSFCMTSWLSPALAMPSGSATIAAYLTASIYDIIRLSPQS